MQKLLMPLVFFLFLGAFIISNGMFIVTQTEQALVRQFGQHERTITKPGLYFKIPFVQDVVRYDRRLIDFNAEPIEVIAGDTKRIIVDAFVRYRIVDPLRFLEAIGPDAEIANTRINTILESSLRQAIGNAPLADLLSDKRDDVMQQIRELVRKQAAGIDLQKAVETTLETPKVVKKPSKGKADEDIADASPIPVKSTSNNFGVEIVDVRIMRADLPQENSEATFRRMQTEREREAKEFRAQGEEKAQQIRSRAERDRTVLIADAEKQSQIVRGEGDAEASRIYADAFSRDPEFFSFYRSMQAYRATLNSKDTRLVISPESDFLRYFEGGK